MGGCQSMSEDNVIAHNFKGIQIICRSWKKTYANLYDYHAQNSQINARIFTITDSTTVHKSNNEYNMLPFSKEGPETPAQALIDFVQERGEEGFGVKSKVSKNRQHPWVVVKSLPSKKYPIKEGDMLRVGKQKVRVKEIVQRQGNQEEQIPDQTCTATGLLYENLTREGKPIDLTPEQTQQYTCKFCLEPGELGNPLMCPCSCSGSSKFIHLKCVQIWLTKTINPKNVGKAVEITWKPLICEICKKTLPFKVYLDGKRYFTVNIPKPKKPYLVLNPIYGQKTQSKGKTYQLVSFSEQHEMSIGRKSDSNIILSGESTVSRHHCTLSYHEGQFFLSDQSSKFGTLVLMRKELPMRPALNGIGLQLGGDLLEMRVGSPQPPLRPKDNQLVEEEEMINRSQSDSSSDHEEEGDHNPPAPQDNKTFEKARQVAEQPAKKPTVAVQENFS